LTEKLASQLLSMLYSWHVGLLSKKERKEKQYEKESIVQRI
jgi:hypothetical protein